MFEFHLKEHKLEDLPAAQEAAAAAIALAKQIPEKWTRGKTYHKDGGNTVETFNHRQDGDFWMARVSNHKDVPFESFQKGILEDHTENEVKYIPLLDSFKEIDPLNDTPDWRAIQVHYKFPKLFSDREMSVFITAIQPDAEIKQFVVVSLPANYEVSPDVTRAYYCSFEVVTFNEQDQSVNWVMAQASDACGNIPRWIQDRSVTSSVVDDVPHFIAWAKKNLK